MCIRDSHYATPVCFACLPPPAPLRVIPTRDQLEAELTRLRAALAEIAALQTEEPAPVRPLPSDSPIQHFWTGRTEGKAAGRYEAAEMARAALGGGT